MCGESSDYMDLKCITGISGSAGHVSINAPAWTCTPTWADRFITTSVMTVRNTDKCDQHCHVIEQNTSNKTHYSVKNHHSFKTSTIQFSVSKNNETRKIRLQLFTDHKTVCKTCIILFCLRLSSFYLLLVFLLSRKKNVALSCVHKLGFPPFKKYFT